MLEIFENTFWGSGAIQKLRDILFQHNFRRVLLVTGKKSFENSTLKEKIKEILKPTEVIRFYEFNYNPDIMDYLHGIKIREQFKPDIVIGIGSGSVMDMAKLIHISLADINQINDCINKNSQTYRKLSKLILIPTTAGSGSEATDSVVIYKNLDKFSISLDILAADYCILDPELTCTMPLKITAAGTFDALCQAVESYWSVKSSVISRSYSSDCIKTIVEIYFRLFTNPDRYCREQMMLASHLSGKAINITNTTLCHALSYYLTKKFGYLHGYACIIFLPEVMRYNSNEIKNGLNNSLPLEEHLARLSEIIQLFNCNTVDDFIYLIKDIIRQGGFSTSINDNLVNRNEILSIAEYVNYKRLMNNPVFISKDGILELLEKFL